MTTDTNNQSNASTMSRRTKHVLTGSGLALVLTGILFSGTAHAGTVSAAPADNTEAANPNVQVSITADSTALLSFEKPKVATVDTTPPKQGSINVQSATTSVKRPMSGTLYEPLERVTLTSPFGKRISPITGQVDEFHTGQDFGADCGTTVFAADSGKVVFAGWHDGGGGNRVEVDHGNGLTTTYNHMEDITVHVGDIVDVGAAVGHVGSTGASTGCHLHFETIKDGGERVDPMGWQYVPITKHD